MSSVNKLVPIIGKISAYQDPGKKTLQKLVYLIERKGVDTGFGFSIHYYGPYSSGLDDALHSLQMQGVIEIQPDGLNHRIHLTGLDETLEGIELSASEAGIVDDVLTVFGEMTAFDLEAITTTDFVARELCRKNNACNDAAIIEGVKGIKGEKFSDERIHQAISLLRENGYRWTLC